MGCVRLLDLGALHNISACEMSASFVMQMNISEVNADVAMKRPCWSLSDVVLEQAYEIPSSAATAIPSDQGSTHDESSSSAAAEETTEGLLDISFADSEDEENEDGSLVKTPSKSARRRMPGVVSVMPSWSRSARRN